MSENVQQALAVALMATPFMFGVLALFAVLILLLGKLSDRKSE